MHTTLAKPSLAVSIGPSGSGTSTFAHRHIGPTEVLWTDGCPVMVSDDEDDQSVAKHASEAPRFVVGKRFVMDRLGNRGSGWAGSDLWPSGNTPMGWRGGTGAVRAPGAAVAGPRGPSQGARLERCPRGSETTKGLWWVSR